MAAMARVLALGLVLLAINGLCASAAKTPCLDALQNEPRFSHLVEMLTAAGLLPSLQDAIENLRQVTILAPNNQAVEELGPEAVEYLADPGNSEDLHSVLLSHMVGEVIRTPDFISEPKTTSLSGMPLRFVFSSTGIMVEEASLEPDVIQDVEGCVVHEVNTLILPKTAHKVAAMRRRHLASVAPASAPSTAGKAPTPSSAPASSGAVAFVSAAAVLAAVVGAAVAAF